MIISGCVLCLLSETIIDLVEIDQGWWFEICLEHSAETLMVDGGTLSSKIHKKVQNLGEKLYYLFTSNVKRLFLKCLQWSWGGKNKCTIFSIFLNIVRTLTELTQGPLSPVYNSLDSRKSLPTTRMMNKSLTSVRMSTTVSTWGKKCKAFFII